MILLQFIKMYVKEYIYFTLWIINDEYFYIRLDIINKYLDGKNIQIFKFKNLFVTLRNNNNNFYVQSLYIFFLNFPKVITLLAEHNTFD